ncbi:hypothetical protein FA95DRAFT_982718 [Auriscalpium vulgare]|uniref:Uncharacterized protein n=1 Tax=Auriscalpium vulgare TaxID=40419 RepID=A0ACB8R890_9AGAM|nr:hypothetical protein FA95DRAFT_982718 [Auriscalpium vulgare]
MGDGWRIHLEYDAIHTRAACVLPMGIESDLNFDDDVRVHGRARARHDLGRRQRRISRLRGRLLSWCRTMSMSPVLVEVMGPRCLQNSDVRMYICGAVQASLTERPRESRQMKPGIRGALSETGVRKRGIDSREMEPADIGVALDGRGCRDGVLVLSMAHAGRATRIGQASGWSASPNDRWRQCRGRTATSRGAGT